jgi:hypothetical protein
MTDHNSVQYALRGSVTAAQTLVNPTEFGGRVRIAYAKLAASGQTLAQNDRVKLFDLPKGARPLLLRTKYGAFGASVTLDIGYGALDASTENVWESALDISAAGSTLGWVDDDTPLTADVTAYAQLEGANPADDKDLEVWLLWALD